MSAKRLDGGILVQLALGLYLLVLGIQGITNYNSVLGKVGRAFGNEFAAVINIIIAVLLLIGGIFLLLEFFVNLGSISSLVLTILFIVWIVYIVYANIYLGFIARNFRFVPDFISWLKEFSLNLLVLAGLAQVRSR